MMDRDLRKIHKNIYNPTVKCKKEGRWGCSLWIGLYISKSLCVAHGGELRLENLEYGGARAIAKFEVNK